MIVFFSHHRSIFFQFGVMLLGMFFIVSCSKPAETKEEFIQKGIIMSDTLLKSVDGQIKDAEMAIDSAVRSGAFVPPPPNTITNQTTTSHPTTTK